MSLRSTFSRMALLSAIVGIAWLAVPATSWASPVSASGQAGASAAGVRIVARHSGMCVNVRFAATTDNAQIIQHPCVGAPNERFHVVPTGTGFSAYVAEHSNKCLNVRGAGFDDNAQIIQFTCVGATNEHFRFVPTVGQFGKLVAEHSGKCIDVRFASMADNAEIIQHTCHNGTNQEFRLVP